ncbi:MAG: hypothetical protein GXY58_04515 [Planctomycetaceae bacterium]|nr:hypothetical protein [Planctomycetaceae bacterium]
MLNRRRFLQSAVAAAGCLSGVSPIGARAAFPDGEGAAGALRITEPFPGAVLNHRHGEAVDGGLKIRVAGTAAPGDRVTVNGQPATRAGEQFTAEVVLRDKVTDIKAVSDGLLGQSEAQVKVRWDRHSMPRYRFSIDDNSFFLRDIAQHEYRSLLDCWYLKMLQDLNTKYGVKFTVNIYYTTGDDFSLPQLSDRYRSQWRDMSDWLKLAFHAHANLPDRPYQDAPPEKLLADLDQVAEQIHRFAGPEAYAPPTVIHWGMTRQESLQPLTTRGVRALSGYFVKWNDAYDVNYRFNDEISEYLSRHDAWMDFSTGIVFSRVDIICNNVAIDDIVPTLEPQIQDPNTAEIFDLFTHEQYFWPFYSHYIPDHADRLDRAIRWVTEQGYKPVFFHEGFLGAPD